MKKLEPKISVVMSVYNAKKYLKFAIESILSQTFRNFEFIIIDDKSTDKSAQIIKSYEDKRIVVISNQKNIGLTKSLNKGIRRARGNYIARIDADDIAQPNRLEAQYQFMENNPRYALCGSWAEVINENGKKIGARRPTSDPIEIKKNLIKHNHFIHSTLFIRKNVIDKINGYDEEFKYVQDYDLILRINAEYPVKNLAKILLKYREDQKQISFTNMQESLSLALKARIKALSSNNYPKWQYIYLVKPILSLLVPISIKQYIIQRRINLDDIGIKDKKLALFFTRGISLKIWDEIGNLDREIKPYNQLAKKFNQILLFTYGDNSDLKYQKKLSRNIKILPNKWNVPSSLYSFLMPILYRKALNQADILKTNQMDGSWAAVLAKWLFKKKLVVRCGYEFLKTSEKKNDPVWKQKIIALVEGISYKVANRVILTSKDDQKFIQDRFKVTKDKILIIPNYIDTELFKPTRVKKVKNRILFIGRLSDEKNLVNVIKAIKGLSLNLVLIGDGPLRDKLNNLAQKTNVRVEFKGKIANDKLPKELNKSELFILPSLYEGNPKALLEAMSCGTCSVGSDVEGISEIINHRINGYLSKIDSKSIKKAILELTKNKQIRQKLSQNARNTILERFSLEIILEKETKLYQLL